MQSRIIKFSPSSPSSVPSQEEFYISGKTKKSSTDGGAEVGVPTLTPLQVIHVKKLRKRRVAATIGGIVAALLVVMVGVLVFICLMRVKKHIRRPSESTSSVPSPSVEVEGGNTFPGGGDSSPYYTQNLKQFTILELEAATSIFSQHNIIGEGGFGLVYKGLLQDGSIVAIKRHLHNRTPYFVHEVKRIATVHHRHLVKLIGYCEENFQQLLVYDYLPNGNIGNHLYDKEGLPVGKLDIRRRFSVALGAAKGLEYLHSLVPPFLHMHFRTSNVLLDENFIAKVSDFGLSKLLLEDNRAGSSSYTDFFLDPELISVKDYSERSEVYSFGVFLLEIISGRGVQFRNQLESQENLVSQARGTCDINTFIDKAIHDHSMQAVRRMMVLALQCVDTALRRPTMKSVVEELERIEEREFGHSQSELGEEIGVVTLGSELFK